ncbi:MAG: SEC-C domain-containing protein [Candidatus Nealsonbacteria bacterium]|nr:SEC-C domain-containing protein [Candidatus Nealsonbacteria bacterium]
MLFAEEVRPLLLHEDRPVRDAAADYLHSSWCQDTSLAPMILRACHQYGINENIHGLMACSRFVLTEESLDGVLQMLADVDDDETAWRLHRILIHIPVDVLLRRESALLATPNLPDEVMIRINRREDLSNWPGSKLWQELQEFANRSEEEKYVGKIDHAHADDLIEALGRHDEPAAAAICELLRSFGEDGGWLEIFLVDLVGQRRLSEAIPLLVDRLRIDTDYLRERVMEALGRIGDPEAVRLIRETFPSEPRHVKSYASGVIGRIKHPDVEEAILELLEIEEDPGIRTILCMKLCDIFSERGIEVVRRQIHSGYDRMIVCLEDHLLIVAHVLGVALSEADTWRAEREERERQRAERQAEMAELGRQYAALKARGIDPFAKSAENPKPLLKQESPPEKIAPVRLDQPRVGRNAPCPCGSGKKFKKCCAHEPP